MRSRRLIGAMVGSVLISTGVAAASDLCHQDLRGSRLLVLDGSVNGYRFAGDRAVVDWSRSATCSATTTWDFTARKRTEAAGRCETSGTRDARLPLQRLSAGDALHVVRVVTAPGSADRPNRLVVIDRRAGRRLASWPLFERPARVALSGDIALLSGATRHALYALRISDGRMALIGITRAGDRPVIGPAGVLYVDDVDKTRHRVAPSERVLHFLPLSTVREELDRPFDVVRTFMSYSKTAVEKRGLVWGASEAPSATSPAKAPYRGADPPRPFSSDPITSISMDGPRVAIAVHDPAGRCDAVLFWNVAWHYVTRLTRASGPTCQPTHAPGGITDVAIAGSRALWTTTYGGQTRLLAASITACLEWVAARPAPSPAGSARLAGDAGILAYAVGGRTGDARRMASVSVVPRLWKGLDLGVRTGRVSALSVDSNRIAVLGADGVARIVTRGGALVSTVETGAGRAASLRPGTLAVLTRSGRLDVFATRDGTRVRSWPVPVGTTGVDLHYGVALLKGRHEVFAMNIHTGKTALLFRAPGTVFAELEGPGAAIAYNDRGHGRIRFVSMSSIEARTR